MENKGFKSLKELHREEIFNYRFGNTMLDIKWENIIFNDEGELVPLGNGDVVFVPEPKLKTAFPFPYSSGIDGDYEKQYELAKQQVNLDYAIAQNTQDIDFMLKNLREKPDVFKGMVYVFKEEKNFPDDTRFKIVKFIRNYPDAHMFKNRFQSLTALRDINDRKAIYSAYKKVRAKVVKKLEELYKKSSDDAFEIIMYNKD